jgi:hypothetical protein
LLRSDANHKYVSVELGYGTTSPYRGMLRARASSVGPWERFEFCWRVQNNPGYLAIRSLTNGKWVAAELGRTGKDYGMLRARSTSIGSWETFSGLTGLKNTTNLKWVLRSLVKQAPEMLCCGPAPIAMAPGSTSRTLVHSANSRTASEPHPCGRRPGYH